MWMSDGALVGGAGNQGYITITRGVDERTVDLPDLPLVPLPADRVAEAVEHKSQLEERGNRTVAFLPAPPSHYPVFEDILVSPEDEIWVMMPSTDDEGVRTTHAAVFGDDGAQLAEVVLPGDFEPRSVAGVWVWGVGRGEFDEPYAVRLRVAKIPPSS